MAIKLKDILLEIGEGSAKPFKWKANHKSKKLYGIKATNFDYRWKTPSGFHYSLDISAGLTGTFKQKGGYTVDFGPFEMGDQLYTTDGKPVGTLQKFTDTEIQTNRGELFSIMATIVDAFKDFIKQEKKTEWGLKSIYFEPSKTQGDARSDSQRRKLYLAYVKKNLRGPKIRNFRDGVVI